MTFISVNPANGKTIATYENHTEQEVNSLIEKSHATFLRWKEKTFDDRAVLMKKAAAVLRTNKARFAKIMSEEMGKPIVQAEAEVEKCAGCCEYYAENTSRFLHDEHISTDASKSYVTFEPIGVVLAVMPWNFPFWQVFRFAAPALMAGNTGVLKHASNVQGSAAAIEEVFTLAGFPPYSFVNLKISASEVEKIINNPRIAAVTLTGSEYAGKKVAEAAGRALKKTVLELGGSDPYIVLADANLEECIATAVTARTINNGQSCIAAKRFIVVEKVRARFEEAFAKKMSELIVGDPLDRTTQIGPLAREDLLIELDKQVQESILQGAKILCGAKRVIREGYFYEPTVLSNVKRGMHAFDQETFGPVAAVISAKDEEEAISLANHPDFGLGASLWSKNTHHAQQIAKRIEAGAVFINGMVKSDSRLPFGGTKKSGYGRELSHFGIKEFVNVKTIWVKE